eukprot:314156-Alexandrium_andersonii.AAC.1
MAPSLAPEAPEKGAFCAAVRADAASADEAGWRARAGGSPGGSGSWKGRRTGKPAEPNRSMAPSSTRTEPAEPSTALNEMQ